MRLPKIPDDLYSFLLSAIAGILAGGAVILIWELFIKPHTR
jgi:uncharacterized protein involved in exopolysaccharide biosynthesis